MLWDLWFRVLFFVLLSLGTLLPVFLDFSMWLFPSVGVFVVACVVGAFVSCCLSFWSVHCHCLSGSLLLLLVCCEAMLGFWVWSLVLLINLFCHRLFYS